MSNSIESAKTVCLVLLGFALLMFALGAFLLPSDKRAFYPEQCMSVPTGQVHVTTNETPTTLVPEITSREWIIACRKTEWCPSSGTP